MPTYEYRCRTCDACFEVRQSFSEDSLTRCPTAASEQRPLACVAPGEGEVRKVFSAPSITFKGDGFYKTDSRSSTSRSTNGAKDKEPSEAVSKSDGTAESASDKKTSGPGAKESSGSGESKGDRAPAGATSS